MHIFLGCLFLLATSLSFANEAKSIGYRVTDPQKTLIQMARDIYKDERVWKKIAQWNKINPPYAIRPGQILVLVDTPVVPLAKTNLVTGAEVPAPHFQVRRHVEQQLVVSKKNTIYIVNERAPSLWMVGRELYGNEKMGVVIAKWNGLAKNSKLALDQKLQLKIKPTLAEKEGTKKLIDVWRDLGNVEMVVRLGGRADSVVVKNKSSSPRPVPQVAPQEVSQVVPAGKAEQPEVVEAVAPAAPTPAPAPVVKASPKPVAPPVVQTAPPPESAAAAAVVAPAVKATPTVTPQEDPELAAVQKPQPPAAAPAIAPSPEPPAPVVQAPVTAPAKPVAAPVVAQPAPAVETAAAPQQQSAQEIPPTPTQPQAPPPREPAAAYVNPDEGLEPKDDSYWLGEEANNILKTISNQVIQEKSK